MLFFPFCGSKSSSISHSIFCWLSKKILIQSPFHASVLGWWNVTLKVDSDENDVDEQSPRSTPEKVFTSFGFRFLKPVVSLCVVQVLPYDIFLVKNYVKINGKDLWRFYIQINVTIGSTSIKLCFILGLDINTDWLDLRNQLGAGCGVVFWLFEMFVKVTIWTLTILEQDPDPINSPTIRPCQSIIAFKFWSLIGC